ncbi:unnamed protein product [Clonostachys rhizophaga]|uniref:C2H2-type domain-containing protein n=1 Tax=Clonostachys rhizophaga TaxID=160324 RepID=A0A9N9VIV9_9HYPO|nr:unnamed protein product [Clonostachys rhizophaga]
MDRLAEIAEKFGDSLKPHHKEQFETSTLEDMQTELSDIQSKQDQTKTLMNMNRIEKFLSGMEDLSKALTAVNNRDVGHAMAYVWGSIRFLLRVTSPTEKPFDSVLDVYEQLGVHLPQLQNFEKLFRTFPGFEQCLVNIYDDVQRFHKLAYKLFSLRTKLWQRLHKSVWKDLNHTFKQLAKSLDTHRKFIQMHSAGLIDKPHGSGNSHYNIDNGLNTVYPQNWDPINDDFNRYRYGAKEFWREFEESEVERKRKQRTAIKAWISSSNKVEEMHKRFQTIRNTCPKSGRWLFRSYAEVSDWMKEDEPPESAIWLHGSKGFGKTILASLIVDELKSLSTSETKNVIPSDSSIYYFYCQEDDNEQRTYLDILKGVLHQMIYADEYILPLCDDRRHQGVEDNLSNAETAQTLIEAFIEHAPRQYIIIDGLDECEPNEARQTAHFFMQQVSKCDNDVKLGQLRVLFTSQTMPELSKQMPEGDASITLKLDDNAEDIRTYVQKRMVEFSASNEFSRGFNLSDADKQQMESIVCHQSQGMFLYAHLTMEYLLQQQTKGELLEKIKQEMLPKKLEHIYEKLLGSIEAKLKGLEGGNSQWEKAKILLGWLVCAKRPLKWHEIQSILSFDTVKEVVDFDNRMLRHNVRKYLGSLVHVLEGGHIRLIHSTARRYIIDNNRISENEVQCRLTALCLRYLSLPCFVNGYQDIQRKENARQGWFSFQDYACSHWHSHINTVIRSCNDIIVLDDNIQTQAVQAQWEFATALDLFIETHGHQLASEIHAELEEDPIDRFQGFPEKFHENLRIIWNHIFTHQKGDFDCRNTVGITQIDDALRINRTCLEEHFAPTDSAINSDTIEDYYGPNLFKCQRTLCRFFYVGYNSAKARDNHHARHDRPFTCPVACNLAPIGFSNKKDRDRHVRLYHREESDRPSRFEAPTRKKGRFKCSICEDTFTRKTNLRGHERSHFGDRPYSCSTCGKAFGRQSDCRRHEKIHARRGA